MTRNALLIYNLVNDSSEHLTARDIFARLKESHDDIVLATVYNNLHYLCDKGLLRRLVTADSPDRFDKTARHDHLICSECGRISDFYMDDITDMIEEKLGKKIVSYDLSCSYVCEKCRAAAGTEKQNLKTEASI